jgi:tRNA dimethylallyltransferase
MKKKLLVICGPTAVGKTSLALSLAKKFNGELVSADSRQVYKKLDIGTGKDLPINIKYQISNIKWNGHAVYFYEIGETRLWGYDLIYPTEEFSVGQYIEIVRRIIEDIWERNKLPILVGGTGFYIKGVVDGIATASIPKNLELRKSLKEESVKSLFEILTRTNSVKAKLLNVSDRNNPRRLIRAIELSEHKDEHVTIFRNIVKKD